MIKSNPQPLPVLSFEDDVIIIREGDCQSQRWEAQCKMHRVSQNELKITSSASFTRNRNAGPPQIRFWTENAPPSLEGLGKASVLFDNPGRGARKGHAILTQPWQLPIEDGVQKVRLSDMFTRNDTNKLHEAAVVCVQWATGYGSRIKGEGPVYRALVLVIDKDAEQPNETDMEALKKSLIDANEAAEAADEEDREERLAQQRAAIVERVRGNLDRTISNLEKTKHRLGRNMDYRKRLESQIRTLEGNEASLKRRLAELGAPVEE